MRVLLSCVNSSVSLVGYDLALAHPFWYCPGNVLRTCGICTADDALWVASDSTLTAVTPKGVHSMALSGPHDNLAHSVKNLGNGMLAVVDTGNSRILLIPTSAVLSGPAAQQGAALSYSPLEGWHMPLPEDAIHLNDVIPWRDGMLASAFSHQPFRNLKQSCPQWNREGLGVLFYVRRHNRQTLATVVASGLNCPHSLVEFEGRIYCCSSSTGTLYCFAPASNGTLTLERTWQITETHFLRGCLRVSDGWVLGGSTRRHARESDAGGMVLFHLNDGGTITRHAVAGVGEIYDILPWDSTLMRPVTTQLLQLPDVPLEGVFPPRCTYDV